MSLLSVCFVFVLYVLSVLVTVKCYTDQTSPVFLSSPDLAALDATSHANKPRFEDPVGITAAGEDGVKTFVLKCHEENMEVVMKAQLFDPGLSAEPMRLRLGPVGAAGDHCVAKVTGNGEYIIRAPLAECGNKVMVDSAVLYSNLLLYYPPSSPVVVLTCRRYTVSSRELRPTWSPFTLFQSAHLDLDFHLRLMTDDWSSERTSSVYFLGETVNMEASVDHHHHLPLRLYVSSCVATLTSDVNSSPRYPFIDHQGCFTDSQLSGSKSRFLSRVHNNHLQIQLEPFLFHRDRRHSIYITCYLEAEPISKSDPVKKACSFINNRWRSVDGDDHVCESCAEKASSISSAGSSHKRVHRSRREGNGESCTIFRAKSIKQAECKSKHQQKINSAAQKQNHLDILTFSLDP
uniref:Zona pellucida sperm-binding protein 3 n=1 Tax=Acanthochromis polyacanthus TaxID=80966 RepID=A0A3Q1HG72_9TELE